MHIELIMSSFSVNCLANLLPGFIAFIFIISGMKADYGCCALGFCKYYIKNCKYTGVAVAHGLYDFFNVVITTFLV